MQQSLARPIVVFFVCGGLVGCGASAGRAARLDAALASKAVADAVQHIRQGCDACLIDARALVTPYVSRSLDARRVAFEASLLLVLREKELGLEATGRLDEVNALAPSVAEVHPEVYIDAVTRIPWAGGSRGREFDMQFRRTHGTPPEDGARLLEAVRAGPLSSVVNGYISLALACDLLHTCDDEIGRVAATGDSAPLLAYRIGVGGITHADRLDAAIATEPRFTEALFFRGRYRLAGGRTGGTIRTTGAQVDAAQRDLEQAWQAFPRSPLIGLTLAGVLRTGRQWPQALTLYDDVLAIVPTHEDALLGRLIALTQLRRAAEAEAAATRLLDEGTWYLAEGRYWRAWNRLQLENVPRAYEDIQVAKRLWSNTDVFTLAGAIDLKRLANEDARTELQQAIDLDAGNCPALKYLGFADTALQQHADAAGAFAKAFDCFRGATADLRVRPIEPDTPGLRAERQRDVAQSIDDEGEASLNAALAYSRAREVDVARQFATIASGYLNVREKAEQLLVTLAKR